MLLRSGALLTSNSQIPEKKPATDESLTGVPGQLLHDVQIWWVEAKCCGWEAICHQVHPEQLHRDQGFRQAQNCCEKDAKTRVMGSSPSRPATTTGAGSTSHSRLKEGPSTSSSAAQGREHTGYICPLCLTKDIWCVHTYHRPKHQTCINTCHTIT